MSGSADQRAAAVQTMAAYHACGGMRLIRIAALELPTFAQNIFDSLHVSKELSLDLPCPDGSGDGVKVAHLGHVLCFRVSICPP